MFVRDSRALWGKKYQLQSWLRIWFTPSAGTLLAEGVLWTKLSLFFKKAISLQKKLCYDDKQGFYRFQYDLMQRVWTA